MLDFLIRNHILIIWGLFVSYHVYGLYAKYIAKRYIPDDWFEGMVSVQIMRKNYRKHPEFIGSYIKTTKDTHYISADKQGNPERRIYEQ